MARLMFNCGSGCQDRFRHVGGLVNHQGRCVPCRSTTEIRIIAPMTVLGISGTFNVLASETAF